MLLCVILVLAWKGPDGTTGFGLWALMDLVSQYVQENGNLGLPLGGMLTAGRLSDRNSPSPCRSAPWMYSLAVGVGEAQNQPIFIFFIIFCLFRDVRYI